MIGLDFYDIEVQAVLDIIIQADKSNNNIKNLNNLIVKMLTSKLNANHKNDFYSQLKYFLESELKNALFSVIKFIEKRGVFPQIFLTNNNKEIIQTNIIQNQVLQLFKEAIKIEKIPKKKVKINIIIGLSIPSINHHIITCPGSFIASTPQ